MTPLVLDTHAWIWMTAGDLRARRHARLLDRAASERRLLLATISVYEASLIGMESESGRRRGPRAVRMRPTVAQWIRDALRVTRVVPVSLDLETATDAAALHGLHADPFDRMIIATTIHAGGRLVTADAKIIGFARGAGVEVMEL